MSGGSVWSTRSVLLPGPGRVSAAVGASLRVGLIAPPWVPVPPVVYGGTELVVDGLARGLVDAGHEVTLFTTGDSTCAVKDRRWVHRVAVGTMGSFMDELGHVQAAYEELAGCDVIHDHTVAGPLWAAAGPAGGPPVVTTAHGEFTPGLIRVYERVAQRVGVVAISRHHRCSAPSVPVEAVIHHGLDLDAVPVGRGDGGYVLFLGRMHEAKGVHRAIRVARAAGKRLLIAAKMWEPEERRYFDRVVAPMLGADAEYLGSVGGVEKLELLGGAEALVNPIRWAEPFGLVMIEALAAGTPVVTFPEGAAPEIVDDAVTGFLCDDEDQMAARLRVVSGLDREACRAAVEQRFTTGRMVEDHVMMYRRLAERSLFATADDAQRQATYTTSRHPSFGALDRLELL